MKFNIKKLLATTTGMIMLMAPTTAFAENIYQNGLSTGIDTVTVEGVEYISVRSFADLHNYNTEYKPEDKTISVTSKMYGSVYVTQLGSDKVYCNGKAYTISPEPVNRDGRLYMPLDSLLEFTQDEKVDYSDREDLEGIGLFNKVPMELESGATISTVIYADNYVISNENGDNELVNYKLVLPQFEGMEDEEFQAEVNVMLNDAYYEGMKEEKKTEFTGNVLQRDIDFSTEYNVNYVVTDDSEDSVSLVIEKNISSTNGEESFEKTSIKIDFVNKTVESTVESTDETDESTAETSESTDESTAETVEK